MPQSALIGEQCGEAADQSGTRQCQQPGEHHSTSDAPANLGPLSTHAGSENAAGADVRGGQAEPKVSRCQDRRARRRSRCRTLWGFDLDDPLAHGAHDPPTARICTQANGDAGSDDHPQLRPGAGRLQVGGDQHQGDHAHGLLAVRCSVCECDHRCGERLPVLESQSCCARSASSW